MSLVEKISRSRVTRFPSELSNDVSPIERGPVDVEPQGHVNVRHRVHQDCFERRDLHDEMRAEMSLKVIPWKTRPQWIQERPRNNILESRAEERRTVPSEFRKNSMQSRCVGSATPVDSSRCTQPTSNRAMMPMPKLRREQRSEVSEIAAAATVGTHDAATSSQRIHVPTVDK